ncbi:uncharacterized protein F5891DRAFT_182174 [Suillus fuscotomentosus]|uniref:CCHC-type domain-containing protein n=1 Tax=Suillus fuscotomentosus TaxID=1912939 RepID=A0AAD4DPS3_9AGAM|nr:uncharacterized protein F5891DRAFT_182174 [Suillus fuscotomentosus]KAG1888467.1 hypothetical protein F5891DRAFT_182174 [Suillus fuscotomentosus]
MTSTESPNPGHPEGAGGKDTGTFIRQGEGLLSDEYASRIASSLAKNNHKRVNLHDPDAVEAENTARAERNLTRAHLRIDDNHIEDVSDDEPMLDEASSPEKDFTTKPTIPGYILEAVDFIGSLTPTTKSILAALTSKGQAPAAVGSMEASSSGAASDAPVFTEANTRIVDGEVTAFEIPRVLLNLVRSKVHIPLTLLTLSSLRKIHEDPASVKMKKGLVTDDPKLFVMDTSSGFPPESSLPPHLFYEAASNFIRLLGLVADDATVKRFTDHRDFCLSRDEFGDNFDSILAFDVEIRRRFFNTHTFPSRAAYLDRWKNVLIKTSLSQQGSSSNRYQPYPSRKPEGFSSTSVSNDGKSFRRGKGEQSSEHLLCVICGRLGHRASSCTHMHTAKNAPVISMWTDKLILKSSSAPICISFNIGRCSPTKHSSDIVHVCSICGSKSHGANSKSCI